MVFVYCYVVCEELDDIWAEEVFAETETNSIVSGGRVCVSVNRISNTIQGAFSAAIDVYGIEEASQGPVGQQNLYAA